jgi:pimeloyl-ACP methyl ester carboxylesterase
METVRSADGTTIAFDRSGDGPPLVMIVGAFCDRSSTSSVAAELASRYTVLEYDRRGRGDSGDTPPYAIEREIEDMTAVLNAAGAPAFVYGHSSGAALALEAAARQVPMRALVAYEPPYTGTHGSSAAAARELSELAEAGRAGDAAERFLLNTGAPAEAVARMRAAPYWPRMESFAHTLPYEVALCDGGVVPAARLAGITVPVLALAGARSPGWAHQAVKAIAAAVPGGEFRVLDGQDHGVAAEALVPQLTGFFT